MCEKRKILKNILHILLLFTMKTLEIFFINNQFLAINVLNILHKMFFFCKNMFSAFFLQIYNFFCYLQVFRRHYG